LSLCKLNLLRNEKKEGKSVGFPNYFKKIGVILIISLIVIIFILKGLHYNFNSALKGNIKTIGITLINIGLAFIALAKDKIEDEMFIHLKLKSIYGAFSFGIVFTLIYPFLDIVSNDEIQTISSQQLVTMMLLSHITTCFLLKRSENK
jgi:CDP-diglyceride synthetase